MRSPKVNKSQTGRITLILPMEAVKIIDRAATKCGHSIEEYVFRATATAVNKDIENRKAIAKKALAKKSETKKVAAKKTPSKKAATKKKASAKKRVAAKKK